jgi:hypothetical protein
MDYRGFLLLGSVMAAGVLASMTACSGPDPGAISFAERPSTGTGPTSSSTSSSSGSTSSTSSSSGGVKDGGGAEAGAGDSIFGTSTFAPPATAPKEANAAAPAQHAGNVEGKDCMTAACHGPGGAGPTWVFAGTIKSAKTGGTAVAGAEIRIAVKGTTFGSTFTDTAGNFYLEKTGGDVPAGAIVGVRTAASMHKMAGPLGAGPVGAACNGSTCHGTVPTASTQGVITFP